MMKGHGENHWGQINQRGDRVVDETMQADFGRMIVAETGQLRLRF